MAIKRFCLKSGCNQLVDVGSKYCEAHQLQEHQRYDQYRESASKRGYNAKWRRARARHLAENPLCVECGGLGKVIAATNVDHIVAHKGDMTLFWDPKNWQSLCHSHHSRKTVREDGGFGK